MLSAYPRGRLILYSGPQLHKRPVRMANPQARQRLFVDSAPGSRTITRPLHLFRVLLRRRNLPRPVQTHARAIGQLPLVPWPWSQASSSFRRKSSEQGRAIYSARTIALTAMHHQKTYSGNAGTTCVSRAGSGGALLAPWRVSKYTHPKLAGLMIQGRLALRWDVDG